MMAILVRFLNKPNNRNSHQYPINHQAIGLSLLFVLLLLLIIVTFQVIKFSDQQGVTIYNPISLDKITDLPVEAIDVESLSGDATNSTCTYYGCFNTYRCGSLGNKLLVYVYPPKTFVDGQDQSVSGQMTSEFYQILEAIVDSKFYTPNPRLACIFVPSIDTLNQNRLKLQEVAQTLTTLEL